jgi:hypothetical protein
MTFSSFRYISESRQSKDFLKFQIYIWEQIIQGFSLVSDIYLRADNPRTFSSFKYISESRQSKDFLKFQIYIYESRQSKDFLKFQIYIWEQTIQERTFSSFRYISETRLSNDFLSQVWPLCTSLHYRLTKWSVIWSTVIFLLICIWGPGPL